MCIYCIYSTYILYIQYLYTVYIAHIYPTGPYAHQWNSHTLYEIVRLLNTLKYTVLIGNVFSLSDVFQERITGLKLDLSVHINAISYVLQLYVVGCTGS
jgi:hypothetical protein